jgi:putative chitinase
MILRNGSSGGEVSKLQARLGIEPTGIFGPITEKRLKEWQQQNNLAVTGILDDAGYQLMFGVAPPPPFVFKLQNLRGHIPDTVLAQIPKTAEDFSINNVLRLTHFLSQCAHESTGFRDVFEGLNYSEAGLKNKFSKYFRDEELAAYARKPEKIASRAYANRNGNGDEASGDGFRFRGRGFIQLTGKDNYIKFSGFVGEDCVANPDLVATKYPLSSAAFYFSINRLWTICDKGDSEAVITELTQRINGGLNGLNDRIKHFKEFYHLLR